MFSKNITISIFGSYTAPLQLLKIMSFLFERRKKIIKYSVFRKMCTCKYSDGREAESE